VISAKPWPEQVKLECDNDNDVHFELENHA
jgi:hypothetical protein